MTRRVINIDTEIICTHGASVVYSILHPRLLSRNVKVCGASVVTVMDKYPLIKGACGLTQARCVEVIWPGPAERVSVRRAKILIYRSDGKCIPNMTPKQITTIQQRVKAT